MAKYPRHTDRDADQDVTDLNTTLEVKTRIDKVMSADPSQYSLSGAQVWPHTDPGFAWLSVSNGFALACVPVEASGDLSPPDTLPRSVVPTTKRGGTVTRGDRWVSGNKFAELTPEDEVQKRPPCYSVLPDVDAESPDTYVVGVDAKKLHDLADALGSDRVWLIIRRDDLVIKGSRSNYPDDKRACTHTTKAIGVVPSSETAIESVGVLMPINPGNTNPAEMYQHRAEQYRKDHPTD